MANLPMKVFEVKLRDLESLLRKRFGNNLSVINYNTESLLPPGENYGSTILKVQALIKKNNNDNEEDLHLVAKMLPATDFQRIMFDCTFTFKKETFLYEQLIPSYQQLERELGVPINEVLDIVPEFFGARYSLTSGGDIGEVDDDAVILMQNLKVLGYYMADRRNGMDLEHGKAVLTVLARFHGIGMALKHHRADFFEIVKIRSKCLKMNVESFQEARNLLIKCFREDPVMGKYFDRIEPALNQTSATDWSTPPTEPWSTIAHTDLWINNIMFQNDHDNRKNVKFVDFQNYLFMSPLRELVFFIMTNLKADVMDNNFDELIDFYYEKFIGTLERMKCDTEPFTRDKFDERLKIDAYEEFPHCPFMLKVMTAEVNKEYKSDELINSLMDMKLNDLCLDRLRRCVNKFIEKAWL